MNTEPSTATRLYYLKKTAHEMLLLAVVKKKMRNKCCLQQNTLLITTRWIQKKIEEASSRIKKRLRFAFQTL